MRPPHHHRIVTLSRAQYDEMLGEITTLRALLGQSQREADACVLATSPRFHKVELCDRINAALKRTS